MMRRVISFLLVLVICMMVPCTALAATNSPGNTPVYTPTGNPKTGDNIIVWAVIMMAALFVMTVVMINRKRFFA